MCENCNCWQFFIKAGSVSKYVYPVSQPAYNSEIHQPIFKVFDYGFTEISSVRCGFSSADKAKNFIAIEVCIAKHI